MPRPPLTPATPWVLCALLGSAIPPPALHAALAAAAGSVFEIAPFVLAAEVLAGRRLARLLPSLGCGCSGPGLPGALSLPATALTWLTFGPAVALGRCCVGLACAAVAARRSGRSHRLPGGPLETAPEVPDVFAELTRIAATALAAAVAVQLLGATPWLRTPQRETAALAFAAGVALGVLAPCATAAVAMAGSFAHTVPAAAAGLLCSAGFVTPPRRRRVAGARHGAGFESAVLALALAALAVRGSAGFINPRLTGGVALAAMLAAAGGRRRTTGLRSAGVVPAAMLTALAAGSPAPPYRADPTTLANAFAGERLAFTGVSATAKGETTLERFAITCCRLDAAAVAVRLTLPLPLPDGSWVAAAGDLVRSSDGSLVLRPRTWRQVAAPRDPFIYR